MPGTVALTGATGFIGATLVRQLAAAGWRVRALVRPASLGRCPAGVEAEWIAGDLAVNRPAGWLVKEKPASKILSI